MKPLSLLRSKLEAYDDSHNFTCDICGREVFSDVRLCEACRKTLPYNDGTVCPLCGRRVREPGMCIECKARPLDVKKARSVCVHEGEATRLVVRFKRGEKYLFRTFAELSLPFAKAEFSEVDALVGVPMSESGLKKRGYNQAELFAERLGELLGKEVLYPVQKHRDTAPQKFLVRRARQKNLEGTFRVVQRKEVAGKRILLVDDTITTGATLSALANALRRAGAAEVYALTLTSVENKFPYGKPPRNIE